jgi:maleylpyruvate isomerase
MVEMKLYTFFRSGTAHRVRIALNIKGLSATHQAVDLRVDEQLEAPFASVNPQKLLPALVIDGQVMTQSPAILEWLEERYPTPALLPAAADDRARVRALAAMVGCDIHPVNNRRILQYLRQEFGADEAAIHAWCGRWIADGFDAYEAMLRTDTERGDFSFGERSALQRRHGSLASDQRGRCRVYGSVSVRGCRALGASRRATLTTVLDAQAVWLRRICGACERWLLFWRHGPGCCGLYRIGVVAALRGYV